MAGVRISKLSKLFGDVRAVDGIDLEIAEGSLTSFLGPSGCGKTTTLRMIAGLEQPTDGEIRIGNEIVYGAGRVVPPERRQIGMVFQSYAVWPHMKVFDNVAYPLQIRKLPRARIRERTMHALETVRMEAMAERYPAQLSGGQQQRVALARAIVFEPVILLLDEPLSNLDAKLREDMRSEIRQLQQRLGVTTLYVTHDQQEALAISDQVAVMKDGRIVQLGSPQEIFERPAERFVANFVGWTNFLPGVVADSECVDIPGARLRCPIPDAAAPGDGVHVAVRPEDLRVASANGAKENVVRGKVNSVMYMGKHIVCGVSVGDQPLQAHCAVAASPAVGDTVELHIPPDATIVLPN